MAQLADANGSALIIFALLPVLALYFVPSIIAKARDHHPVRHHPRPEYLPRLDVHRLGDLLCHVAQRHEQRRGSCFICGPTRTGNRATWLVSRSRCNRNDEMVGRCSLDRNNSSRTALIAAAQSGPHVRKIGSRPCPTPGEL
jgi:hypothetical protein